MPIGLLIPVVLAGWGTGCVLTSWRHLGGVARVPALVTSELPFLGCYLLIASTAGAWPTVPPCERARAASIPAASIARRVVSCSRRSGCSCSWLSHD
jgi:hypothetical protein